MNRLTNQILNILDSAEQNTKSSSYLDVEFSELIKSNKSPFSKQIFVSSDANEMAEYFSQNTGRDETLKQNENQNDESAEVTDEQTYRKNVIESTEKDYGLEHETYEKEKSLIGVNDTKVNPEALEPIKDPDPDEKKLKGNGNENESNFPL